MGLNELSAWSDLRSHERRKHRIRFLCIFDENLQHNAAAWIHGGFPQLLGVHFSKTFVSLNIVLGFPCHLLLPLIFLNFLPLLTFLTFITFHFFRHLHFLHLHSPLLHKIIFLLIRIYVTALFALGNLVERRLRDKKVTGLDDLRVVTEKEREEQRANVRPIHVGIGHNHNPLVAQFRKILHLPNANTHGNHKSANFVIRKHLIHASLLHVKDFSTEG